jgi:hypothetical protein
MAKILGESARYVGQHVTKKPHAMWNWLAAALACLGLGVRTKFFHSSALTQS